MASKRGRVNLADDMSNLGRDLKSILNKMITIDCKISDFATGVIPHIRKDRALNYLIAYHEFFYYFTLDMMDKVQD